MSKEYFFDTTKLNQLDKSKLIFIVYSKWNAVLVNEMVEESKNTFGTPREPSFLTGKARQTGSLPSLLAT